MCSHIKSTVVDSLGCQRHFARAVQINPRYVMAAQDLGASAWKSFLAVTLPLSVPGMASLNVPAGDHTIYTMPRAGRFELIISKDNGQFHTVHAPDLELGRIVMQRADRAETMEGLTFAFEPKDSGAVFKLIWDNREYVVHMASQK